MERPLTREEKQMLRNQIKRAVHRIKVQSGDKIKIVLTIECK